MRNETHEAFEHIAAEAGWNDFTLLTVIARWAEDNGQYEQLLGYLSEIASEEEEEERADPLRRVVFSYLVPVHVEVEDGLVSSVTVIDETPVKDPCVIEGNPAYLAEAIAASDDGQPWPSWRFGY